jgi:hypothetical protein
MKPTAALFLIALATAALAAEEVLFPAPLHLTREISDPITGSKSIIDQYCHGNRVVAVSGKRTSIAEYDKGLLTTIDFEAGTYSVTKFADLARAWERGGPPPREDLATMRAEPEETVRVKPDRRVTLSRAAAEVLTGLAWPRRRDPSADAVLDALRSETDYFLPLEHVVEYVIDGEKLEIRNVIVRVGSELAPPDALAVPPGARLVESEVTAARRLLDELDGIRARSAEGRAQK